MTKKQPKIFTYLIFAYVMIALIFVGRIGYEINKPAQPHAVSSIPTLDETKLNKVITGLSARIKVNPEQEVDLTKFKFGKTEPFN